MSSLSRSIICLSFALLTIATLSIAIAAGQELPGENYVQHVRRAQIFTKSDLIDYGAETKPGPPEGPQLDDRCPLCQQHTTPLFPSRILVKTAPSNALEDIARPQPTEGDVRDSAAVDLILDVIEKSADNPLAGTTFDDRPDPDATSQGATIVDDHSMVRRPEARRLTSEARTALAAWIQALEDEQRESVTDALVAPSRRQSESQPATPKEIDALKQAGRMLDEAAARAATTKQRHMPLSRRQIRGVRRPLSTRLR